MSRPRHAPRAVRSALTALLVTVGLAAPVAAASPREPVPGSDPWVIRTATVELRREHFSYLCDRPEAGPPPRPTLTFFPYDVTAQVVEDHSMDDGQGTISWSGHEVGHPDNQVDVEVSNACAGDDSGKPIVLEGFADLGARGAYAVHPAEGRPSTAVFEEWDLSKLPRDTEDDAVDSQEADAPPAPPRGRDRSERSRPAVVDVLLLFTPKEAAKARGHRSFRSLRATASTIETRMNRALSDSGVRASVDVVHAQEVTGFKNARAESDAGAMLDLLSNPTDRHVGAEAAALRERYAADTVMILADNGGSGMANRPDDPGPGTAEQAFAVEGLEAVFTDGVSHEMGHNLGLDHDRWTLAHDKYGRGTPSTTYPYNTGWITPDQKYSTVMAYEWNCAAGKKWCDQVNQYANRTNRYGGQPLGDKDNDQARVLKKTTRLVGDYRVPAAPRPRHTLTLAASPARGGTTRAFVWGPYKTGTRVVVRAYPAAGYAFAGWTLDGTPHANKSRDMSLAMNAGHRLVARFTAGCAKPPTGGFLKKWTQLGGAKGRLKCPTGDRRALPKGGGFQHFQGGSLYYSPKTGMHPVWGAFRTAWQKGGWERGRLGYPRSGEKRLNAAGDVRQWFQGGSLTWHAKSRKVTAWYAK
ncbi:InlB B-repeat-containing protein [Streptomyces formicae]|uniref:Sporulation protein-related proteins n=1 Tax=Streptomyces formicae TaxID=1616117 RepID=A0A291QCY2_9ACTN|nr:zinc-dependent metalloprotease family protein [Streptomyces formicae]ATL29640.1 Sporulation protein-related proteins [Streptomyces formicae]